MTGSTALAWTFSCGDAGQGSLSLPDYSCILRHISAFLMATVVTLLHYDSTHPFIYTPERWKDMSLERVLTGHGRGEAEELGGRLVAVEHIHATCRARAHRAAHQTDVRNASGIILWG